MMIRGAAAAALLSGVMAFGALAQPSERVSLSGEVQAPVELTARDLRAMPPAAHSEFTQSRSGGGTQERSTVRGVKLLAVLERAGLRASGRDDWKTMVVVVTATDGYRAVFGWPELTNTAVGEGVLLLYERDGKPLDPREGAIALLSTADRRLGARHVRNVARIEVRALD